MRKLFFLFSIVLPIQLFAEVYEINKDHSRVAFKIPYMGFSEVEGAFTDYQGRIEFNVDKVDMTKVTVKIKTASINTLDKKRDSHLRGPDFFFVQKYPYIVFNSTKVTKSQRGKYQVFGNLEIRGVTRPTILQTEYKGKRKDHVGKESLFFKASTRINRKDFKIIWNKSLDNGEFLLGDEIDINLLVQAQPIGNKTSFSTHMSSSTAALENQARFRRGEIDKPTYESDEEVPVLQYAPVVSKLNPKSSAKAEAPSDLPWIEMVVGFLGFCLVIGVCILLKIKLIKFFKIANYSEASLFSFLGDALIILITFIYSVWYFKYLFN